MSVYKYLHFLKQLQILQVKAKEQDVADRWRIKQDMADKKNKCGGYVADKNYISRCNISKQTQNIPFPKLAEF